MKILMMVLMVGLMGCEYNDDTYAIHCSEYTEIAIEHVEYATINTVKNNTCNSISVFVVLNRGELIDDPERPFLLGATKVIKSSEGLVFERVITYDGYVTNFIDSTDSNYNYNHVLGDNFISKMNWTTLEVEFIVEGSGLFSELMNSTSYSAVHNEVMEVMGLPEYQ